MLASVSKVLLARSAASSVVQSLAMKVVVMVLSLGCGMITARALGLAGRGEQSAIVLWPYIISGFAGLGISPAVCFWTSRDRSREGGFLFAGSLIVVMAGFVGAGVGAAIVPLYLKRYSHEVVWQAQVMLLFAPAILLGYVLRSNLEARAKFSSSNASRIWPFVFTFAVLLVLWATQHLTPFTAGLAIFGPVAVQTAWLLRDLASRFDVCLRNVAVDVQSLVSYGLRTYGTDVFSTLSTQVDLAFIIVFLSPAALGLYTVSLTAARQLNVLQAALNIVLLPKASSLGADSALELVGRMTRISSLVTFAAAIVAFAVLPVLIPMIYGEAFRGAAVISRVLVVETFLMGVASVLAQGFNATGRPGIVSLLQAVWVFACVLLLFILVPRLGVSGAAYALAVASLLRLLATLASYPLVLGHAVPSLIPKRRDIDYAVAKARAYLCSRGVGVHS
jgi:O-antigen/teichoic acid export membrane protein